MLAECRFTLPLVEAFGNIRRWLWACSRFLLTPRSQHASERERECEVSEVEEVVLCEPVRVSPLGLLFRAVTLVFILNLGVLLRWLLVEC